LLGEHNDEILATALGRSPDSVAALYQQGVLYKGDK
jgi:hypothetical protein